MTSPVKRDFERFHWVAVSLTSLGKGVYAAVIAALDSIEYGMATLTVRNLGEDVVRRLRIRAAGHGRSAEAEHREILRLALAEDDNRGMDRQRIAERLAEFRRRTGGRGAPSAARLLGEARAIRNKALGIR